MEVNKIEKFVNKVTCGNCLELMKELPDESIDLITTDPPFSFIAHGAGWIKKTKNTHIENINNGFGHDFKPEPFLAELPRIMKKINLYIWCSKNLIPNYLNWALSQGYFFDVLTWHKKNPVPLWNNKYISDTEYCLFIKESGAYFNSNLPDWKIYTKWWLTNIQTERNGHPTPKPVELMKKSILVSSKEGDVVLDPYLGSGTTAVACKQLNRKFIGFEINPEYHKIAEKRLEQLNMDDYHNTQKKLTEL